MMAYCKGRVLLCGPLVSFPITVIHLYSSSFLILTLIYLEKSFLFFLFPVAYPVLSYATPHLHNIDFSLPAELLHSWLLFHNSFCARFCTFFLPSFCHAYQFFRTWDIYNSVYSRTVVDFTLCIIAL